MIAENTSLAATNGTSAGEIDASVRQLKIAVPAESQESKPAIRASAVTNAIRRSWKLALPLGICLAALGAAAGWSAIEPKFTASAYLKVDADTRPLIFETADRIAGGAPGFALYKNTQTQLMVTPFVLNAALRDEDASSLAEITSRQDPVSWLQKELKATFPTNGEIMQVSISDPVLRTPASRSSTPWSLRTWKKS